MKKISKTKNDKSIFSEIDLNKMFSANRILQPFQMFYEVNKVVCNRITFYNSKPANLLPALLKKNLDPYMKDRAEFKPNPFYEKITTETTFPFKGV